MRVFRCFQLFVVVWLLANSCASTRTIGESRRENNASRQDQFVSEATATAAITPTPIQMIIQGKHWLRMLGMTHDNVAVARVDANEALIWGAPTTQTFTDVKQIARGTKHTVLLHDDGTISAYGDNEFGQTNVSNTADIFTKIVAGDTFSVGMTESGKIVGWGQAVVEIDSSKYAITPYPLDVTNAVDVQADGHMTLVHHQDGTVSLWGDSETQKSAGFSLATVQNPQKMVISSTGLLFVDQQGGVQWFSFYPSNAEYRSQSMTWPTDVKEAIPGFNDAILLITSSNQVFVFRDAVGIVGPIEYTLLHDAPMVAFGQYVIGLNDRDEFEVLMLGGEPFVARWRPPFPNQMSNAVELNVKVIGNDNSKSPQVIYRYLDETVRVFEYGEEVLNYPYSVAKVAWMGAERGYFSVIAPSGEAVIWGAADSVRQMVPDWARPLRYLDLPTEYVFSEICSVGILQDGSFVEWGYEGSSPCVFRMGEEPLLQGKDMFPRPPAEASQLVKVIRPADKTRAVIGLRSDGQVVAWGRYGENRPATVPANATDVIDITNTYYEMYALRKDGQIVVWDINKGEGLAPDIAMPSRMIRVFQSNLGHDYRASLRQDGTLVIWTDTQQFEYPGMADAVDVDMYYGLNIGDDDMISFVVLRRDGTITHVGALLAFPHELRVRMHLQ